MSRTGILIAIHGAGLTNAMRVCRGCARMCARSRLPPAPPLSHRRRTPLACARARPPLFAPRRFLPAHAVVIEVFPYVMYASMYRDLAASAGLYYYRIQSLKPPNVSGAAALLYEDAFINSCDGEKRHISSPAAFLDYECNWRSKSSP